jgi:excisionase family DNA binding protein
VTVRRAGGDTRCYDRSDGTRLRQRLLTVAEAMEELHCSESTVRRLIQSGELPAVRIGAARAIRVSRAAVVDLLEPVEPVVA